MQQLTESALPLALSAIDWCTEVIDRLKGWKRDGVLPSQLDDYQAQLELIALEGTRLLGTLDVSLQQMRTQCSESATRDRMELLEDAHSTVLSALETAAQLPPQLSKATGEPTTLRSAMQQIFADNPYARRVHVNGTSVWVHMLFPMSTIALPGGGHLTVPVEFEASSHKTRQTLDLHKRELAKFALWSARLPFLGGEDEAPEVAFASVFTLRLNPATGHDEIPCVVSIRAERAQIMGLNMDRIEPLAAIGAFAPRMAKDLSTVYPYLMD